MTDPASLFKSRCSQIVKSGAIVKFLKKNEKSVFVMLCSSIIDLLEKVHASRGREIDHALIDFLECFQEQNKITASTTRQHNSLLALVHAAKVIAITLRTLHEVNNGADQSLLVEPDEESKYPGFNIPSTSENIVVSASFAGPIERIVKDEPLDEEEIHPGPSNESENRLGEVIIDHVIKEEEVKVEIAPDPTQEVDERAWVNPAAPVHCTFCNQGFCSDAELEGHRRNCAFAYPSGSESHHTVEESVNCDLCGRKYINRAVYLRHRVFCAKVDNSDRDTLFDAAAHCNLCGRSFINITRHQTVCARKAARQKVETNEVPAVPVVSTRRGGVSLYRQRPDPLGVPRPKLSVEEKANRRRRLKALATRERFQNMTPDQKAAFREDRARRMRKNRKRWRDAKNGEEPDFEESVEDEEVEDGKEPETSPAKRMRARQ